MKLVIIPLVAILAIAGLEALALAQEIDGTLMSLAYAAISATATSGAMYGWHKYKGKK